MKVDTLSKSFGEKKLFTSLSFEVKRGEIIAITGESGSGKTTLFRIISGLDRDFSGKVEETGKISYDFQEPRLLPWYTALKNASVAESETGKGEKILRELGLSDSLNKKPSELSGGMQKRVALARSLAAQFDTLLLDEPFEGLDGAAAKNAMEVIRRYTKNGSVLLITHDIALAGELDGNVKI